jgi:hypothetical protein
MAWIESHQELGRHPKTRRLARLLNVSLPCVVGHLHFFWWWALDYACGGDVTRFETGDLADGALWEGDPGVFVEALIGAGFLDQAENGDLRVHDWDEYAGRLLDQRKANAEKQKRWRERHKTDTSPSDNRNVTVTLPIRNGATVPNQTEPHQREDTHVSAAVVEPPSPQPPSERPEPLRDGAGAPVASASTTPSDLSPQSRNDPPRQKGEKELDYWLRLVKEAPARERVAMLVRMAHEKIDIPAETASYARIGALAKKHTASLLAKHIMSAAAQHIDGDPLDYLTALCNKTTNTYARAAPFPGHPPNETNYSAIPRLA